MLPAPQTRNGTAKILPSLGRYAGLCFAAAALFASGCRSLPASKPEAFFTPDEAHGARIYQVNCARCHYPNTTQGKKGPGLQALTKVKAMPSGAPPTDERLVQTILHGHGLMQGVPLSDDDLHYLLIYLHTL
jgi:mono/diheme cytochrome c family protein